MKPTHVFLLMAAVAIAAVAGTYAAMRTTRLAVAAAQPVRASSAAIARQNRALDRAQAALVAELKRKPPALPHVPTPAPAPAVPTGTIAAAAAPPVVYVRPKPIVHVIHRHGEGEREHEGGDSASGAGFDD